MSEDYEIGFGRPPQHSKWKPGQSGNPKGRPKGSKNMSTIMRDILSRKVTVTENGKSRRVPYVEAFSQGLAAKGLHGTARDQIAVLKAIHDYMPAALVPEEPEREFVIRFVESDGNGRPLRRDMEQSEEIGESGEKNKSDDIAGAETGSKSDAALEAAWRASGIDDEPEPEPDGSSTKD